MSYTQSIAQALIDTLSRTAGLPTFQLAGHVPNLAFWIAEVRHAVGVIDGYAARFTEMAVAQAAYDAEHTDENERRARHEYDYQPLKLAITPDAAQRLKRQCIASAERLIDRCLKEGLIDGAKADELRSNIRFDES